MHIGIEEKNASNENDVNDEDVIEDEDVVLDDDELPEPDTGLDPLDAEGNSFSLFIFLDCH